VAFGDPTFKAEGSQVMEGDTERDNTQRLRYSAAEIADIKSLTSGATQLFLQGNDLKRFFLSAQANSAFLLHVSTHAFADVDNPENSRMVFSPEIRDNPPDYVFLRELYDLDLSRVRLATISACDTERGKIIRGEGMQAFSRALLSAGSSSSLTALWKVEDEPTAEFMKQFYFFALKEHRPKAEALQLAKLKFLHSNTKLADPRLWAAFVLNGDGLTPLPAVISWSKLTVAAAIPILVLLCLGLSIRLRSKRRQHGEHDS
jgi:CHAT domain-containing protein